MSPDAPRQAAVRVYRPPQARRWLFAGLTLLATVGLILSLLWAWREGPWPWLAFALIAAFGLPWAAYAWYLAGQVFYRLGPDGLHLHAPGAHVHIALSRVVWAGLEVHYPQREAVPEPPRSGWGLSIGLIVDDGTQRTWSFYSLRSGPHLLVETDDQTVFVLSPARPAAFLEHLRALLTPEAEAAALPEAAAEPQPTPEAAMASRETLAAAPHLAELEGAPGQAAAAQQQHAAALPEDVGSAVDAPPEALPQQETRAVTAPPEAQGEPREALPPELAPMAEADASEPAPAAKISESAGLQDLRRWGWGLLMVAWLFSALALAAWLAGWYRPAPAAQMGLSAHFVLLGLETGLSFYAWRVWRKPAMGLFLGLNAAVATGFLLFAFWNLAG
ncbi:MAG: hypothetical protein GXO36_02060 [Chloroflexi bacterium]|nr:hypothetical protein [Chloroflexota bacterium]